MSLSEKIAGSMFGALALCILTVVFEVTLQSGTTTDAYPVVFVALSVLFGASCYMLVLTALVDVFENV